MNILTYLRADKHGWEDTFCRDFYQSLRQDCRRITSTSEIAPGASADVCEYDADKFKRLRRELLSGSYVLVGGHGYKIERN